MSNPTLPWETLGELIDREDRVAATDFINSLSPSETARTISRLTSEHQQRLFSLLNPEDCCKELHLYYASLQ